MPTNEPDAWVFRSLTGRYIASDHASGGYPYHVKRLADATLWRSSDTAQQWADSFRPIADSWVLCPITVETP